MIHALHVIDLCSMLRCDTVLSGDHRYGNRRYENHHMGTIDMGTIDIRRYQYNDIRRYIQLCVIACLGFGGVHMYHHSRQVGVGLRYCDTYQLRLCDRSVVAITLSCNCRTGQRCHNIDSLIRDTAGHSDHWVVRRATVTLNDPTTTRW